ncbi:MAG TPA: polysaccharide lyase family protein [Acidobacteriaceae bacterium]|nr:polysaccharide lyase family protein [Acidobacteriaceae bacterium]
MLYRLSIALFVVLLFAAVQPAKAEDHTLWEIGKPDQSSYEFHATPAQHILYRVGESDWNRDWPTLQRLGAAYEIQFSLNDAPRGRFELRAALLLRNENPDLQVEINGHRGLAIIHPQLFYNGNVGVWDNKSIVLPTQYLVKGTNTLVLTSVEHKRPTGETVTPGGPLYYDYLSLVQDPRAKYAKDEVEAAVTPSVFYRRAADGELVELVDADLHFNGEIPSGNVDLKLQGHTYSATFEDQPRFGDFAVEYQIPEWQGTSAATLDVSAPTRRTFHVSLTPERKWTVFIVPHTHVDIGYTDFQGKVAEGQAVALEEASGFIKQNPDFRFSTDGSWNLQQFLNTRPQPEQTQMLDLIRAGKLGVPADYFNLLTGYASLESLYRSLFYTKRLSATQHIPFNYADTTDVPSYTGAYPTVLASSGIKYWAVGGNQDRAPVLSGEQWNQLSPFWWKGRDGEKVLFSYSWGYAQIGRFFSLDPTNTIIRAQLPIFLAQFDRPSYKPDAVLMYGAQDENTALHPALATFVPGWNSAYAYPKLQYALFADYFNYIDQHYGDQLPVRSGDLGSYWEDGIGSDAYYAGLDRENQSEAISTEIASAAAHTINPQYHPPAEEVQAAWNHILLFAEHTWGAGNSIGQPDSMEAVQQLAVKDNFVTQAHFELDDVQHRSLFELTRAIRIGNGGLVVFNPLNWKRSGLVEADLRKGDAIEDLNSHQDVPYEIMTNQENFLHVRFLASDIPELGYKCYQIHAGNQAVAAVATEPDKAIENRYYRIVVDPDTGAIRSIFDKDLKRELVDAASPYRFGEYLYVTGGDPNHNGQSQMIHPDKAFPVADLTVHQSVNGKYLGEQKTFWGHVIRLQASNVNTPTISLEIRLFDGEKKIEFDYHVNKTGTTEKEGVYFAFPSAVAHPNFAYSSQVGWVDPAHDILPGGDAEWFSVQHWMAVYDSNLEIGIVPINAPLATFGDINRGLWPVNFVPKSATLFSYAMNNYWHTNYRAGQGGEFHFRYVLTSAHSFEPANLTRLGVDSQRALSAERIANQDKTGPATGSLPAEGGSFLQISNPDVLLTTWKLAENGEGTIVRLEEIAGKQEQVALHLSSASLRSASLCNAMEDDLSSLPVKDQSIQLTMKPNEVVTVRLVH